MQDEIKNLKARIERLETVNNLMSEVLTKTNRAMYILNRVDSLMKECELENLCADVSDAIAAQNASTSFETVLTGILTR